MKYFCYLLIYIFLSSSNCSCETLGFFIIITGKKYQKSFSLFFISFYEFSDSSQNYQRKEIESLIFYSFNS